MSETSSNSSLAESSEAVTTLECLENTPISTKKEDDKEAWKSLIIARVALWGAELNAVDNEDSEDEKEEGDDEQEDAAPLQDTIDRTPCAVQALLWQTKDGRQAGSAHGSVKKRWRPQIQDSYIVIEQPKGYVTRMEGYHSLVGTSCLLHSLTLEFGSGQIIELIGQREEWKGDRFVVEDLPNNFYLSSLVFEQGVCTGYKGYSTDQPLGKLMKHEPPLDMVVLKALQDDDADSSDDEANDETSQDDPQRTVKTRPIDDDDEDLDEWITASLPAKYIPEPPTRDEFYMSHVALCGGWAVHGVLFYFFDRHRTGTLQDNDQKTLSNLYTEVTDRGGNFVELDQPGGRIVRISGHKMTADAPRYLCHSLKLEFESEQVIEYHGANDDWKGKYFSYDMPNDFFVTDIHFSGGRPTAVTGVKSFDLHDTEDMVPPPIENRKPGSRGCFSMCLPK